ncbi:hypothetical protein LLG10_04665 [bacterium]|nr:hypothetical protein [bacterium]
MKHAYHVFIGIICISIVINVFSMQATHALIGQGVEVYPYTVNQPTEIKIYFEIAEKLRVHEWIKFLFSPGFQYTKPEQIIPKPPCESCLDLPIVQVYSDGSIEFKFNSHIELDPSKEGYRDINVTLRQEYSDQLISSTRREQLSSRSG